MVQQPPLRMGQAVAVARAAMGDCSWVVITVYLPSPKLCGLGAGITGDHMPGKNPWIRASTRAGAHPIQLTSRGPRITPSLSELG